MSDNVVVFPIIRREPPGVDLRDQAGEAAHDGKKIVAIEVGRTAKLVMEEKAGFTEWLMKERWARPSDDTNGGGDVA